VRPASAPRAIPFRGDIEGLRGVAVLLVVLDHLRIPAFGGGYIGVDVFFVISGYLITSLLAAGYARNADAGHGTISISGFYVRRARRILPAALTVIAAVLVASRLLLNDLRSVQIQHDALWALAFGSKLNEIDKATDYFSSGLAASPFQHYWSLAVEEQFYLVCPALFLLVAGLAGRRMVGSALGWRPRVALAIGAAGVASLAWSAIATTSSPASAYLSTFTRAWELALGALLGIVATSSVRIPARLARSAAYAGTALLVVGCATIDTGTPFPGFAALVPTLAAALLIVGGLAAAQPLPARALCLRPLRFVGRISYSIYLWHWPLIVFTAALYPTLSETAQARVIVFILTIVLSALSFWLVERPGLRITFAGRPGSLTRALVGASLVAAVFVGALSAIAPEGSTGSILRPSAADGATIAARITSSTPSYREAMRIWQAKVRAGLGLRRLPASLQPLAPHLATAFPPPCIHGLSGALPDECIVGNPAATHVAVLNGDSHAEMLRNAVWRAFDPSTWRIHIFARSGCGWAGAANGTVSASGCRREQAGAIRRIRALHPDVLLLSEHLVETPFRSRADIAASLATFTQLARKTIVIGHTPLPTQWSTCLAGSAYISRCTATADDSFHEAVLLERRLATKARATFVDTTPWLCTAVGGKTLCPPVIAGAPAFKDDTHISAELQLELVPVVRAMLRSAGVSPSGRAPRATSSTPDGGSSKRAGAAAAWESLVRAGLRVRTLPPSLLPLRPHLVRYLEPYCNPRVPGIVIGECAVGSRRARHVAVVTGDSHAGMFQLAVALGLGRTTWRVHVFQRAHCGWAGTVGPESPVSVAECRTYQAAALARIEKLRPEILVLSEADVVTPYRSAAEISSALAALVPLAGRVVVLGHTPTAPSFDTCLSGLSDISRCVGEATATYRADRGLERSLATAAGAAFVDTSRWLCADVAGRLLCPAVIDGAPVWRDGTHLTSDIEQKLIPLLRSELRRSPARGAR
jgi:peptidoglycan/LPS O-acetylase OafA/YrhL